MTSSQILPSRRSFLRTSLATAAATSWLPAITTGKDSNKKGLCSALRNPARLKTLQDLQVDWVYTWAGKRPDKLPASIDFFPMIWGYWGKPEKIKQTANRAKKAGIDTMLGFNEPDGKKQANLSVEKALKAWPHLVETELRLGSPACKQPDNDWMKKFMSETKRKDLRVDFVCVHSYGGTDAKAFLKRMDRIHKLYRKPIWITEFAVGDWQAKNVQQNRHKPDQVLKFMEKVLPGLQKRDYIEKFAWFPPSPSHKNLGTSALYKNNGQLTKLGEFYRDFED